jgi:3-methyladenine DNA glycosylase/8-oxoguanine DNA glycosylase
MGDTGCLALSKKTVEQIIVSNNHYCIGLKGNQKKLLQTAQQTAQTQPPLSSYQEQDASHGRWVERTIRVFAAAPEWASQWQGLSAFVSVERRGIRDGNPFERHAWFILSQVIPAPQAASLIRGHRASIENQVNWVKDVVQGEDRSGIRAAQPATLMAFLRSWALTAFRKAGFDSFTKATRKFKHDLSKLFSLL